MYLIDALDLNKHRVGILIDSSIVNWRQIFRCMACLVYMYQYQYDTCVVLRNKIKVLTK